MTSAKLFFHYDAFFDKTAYYVYVMFFIFDNQCILCRPMSKITEVEEKICYLKVFLCRLSQSSVFYEIILSLLMLEAVNRSKGRKSV